MITCTSELFIEMLVGCEYWIRICIFALLAEILTLLIFPAYNFIQLRAYVGLLL